MSKRNPKFYKLLAIFLIILSVVLLAKWNSSSAALVTRTWDGGGATNNWSEAANWSGDVAPAAGDDVVFDGTSTKNATIDVDFAIANLNIGGAYPGTMTLANAKNLTLQNGSSSSQAGGAFVCGNNSEVFFRNVNFTQTGGAFNCQNGRINGESFNLIINGGAFNAPSGLMEFRASGAVEIGAGGTFHHNGGTIAALGDFLTFKIVNGTAATLEINNLTLDMVNPTGAVTLNEAGDKLRVLGDLNLFRGGTQGTFESRGAVSISSSYGNNNQTGKLQITGPALRFINLPALAPNVFYVPIELDAPNVTINAFGPGPVRLLSLDLISGTFNTGSQTFSLGRGDSFLDSTQTGGTFNCGGPIFFNAVNFTQTGGQFNCQSGSIDSSFVNLFFNGGTFNAPAATMTIQTPAIGGATIQRGGAATFNHHNGTIVFAGETVFLKAINGASNEFDFGTLVVNVNNQLNLETGNVKARVFGNLNLNSGIVLGGQTQTRGSIEARGNVTIGGNVPENSVNNADFILAGNLFQTFTNNGGGNLRGRWTVNKPSGEVVLISPLNLSGSAEDFILTEGIILTGANTIDLGTRNVSRTNGRVLGNLKRRFTATGTKIFDVGTSDGYTPVSVEVTTLGANPTDLTVGIVPGTHPVLNPNISLGSYWKISESGNLTANLTFNYLQTDVNGNENNYKVNRITADGILEILEPPTATIDTANNTATVLGVTEFSDWTLSATTPPLVLSPLNPVVNPNNTQTFTASGGQPPYVFSLPVNNSGASINAATGFYVAGATFFVEDTVRVTDAFNQTRETNVRVGDPFLVTHTGDSGIGSLRQAIINSNNIAGMQQIRFNIPGPPPFTISPASALPVITDAVEIHGGSQPGFPGTPIIEISGANAGNVEAGLKVQASRANIFMLAINRFQNSGISLVGLTEGAIFGNYIGLGTDGVTPRPNGFQGIALNNSSGVAIGETIPLLRNVISGNSFDGIVLNNSDGNSIRGNRIGVGADGTSPLGNGRAGISISASSDQNIIEENIVAFTGTNNPPVAPDGAIVVTALTANSGNRIHRNQIFSNVGLGLDLGASGITPNDVCDADTGANALQNFPVLTSATITGGNLTLQVTLNSTANENFVLHFYSSPKSDPSGSGEGKTFLGTANITTNAGCDGSVSVSFPAPAPAEQFISATATDANGNTSEFSAAILAATVCNFSISPTAQNFNSGGGSGTVSVTTDQNCAWTVASNDSFMTVVSGTGGTGQGFVNFTVAPNTTGAARTGTMTIAGQTFTVTQAAICTFSINPTAQNYAQTGGAGVINVQTNAGCQWTATSNDAFITITGGSSGKGNGNVAYTVAPAPNDEKRTGTISVAGRQFTIVQSANNSACAIPAFINSVVFRPLGFDSILFPELAADVNRDGVLDLVFHRNNPARIAVAFGKGDRTFQPVLVETPTDTFDTVVFNVLKGDFNRDGHLDIAAATFSGGGTHNIRVGLGNGNGNFGFRTVETISQFAGIFNVTVADFDNRGESDLVFASNAGVLQIAFGSGEGTFGNSLFSNGSAGRMHVADFNSDGKLDIVAVSVGTNRVTLLLGDGSGRFTASALIESQNAFGNVIAEDFNRDGKPDFAVTETMSGIGTVVKTFLGNGAGGFAAPISSPAIGGIGFIATADFNRDGKTDLAYAATNPSSLAVLTGDGAGNFSAPNNLNAQVSGGIPLVGDFNSDGKTDIAINSGNQGITVLSNTCGGLTQKPKIDFDGDGKTDIAIFRPSTSEWFILRSSDGTFFGFPFGANGDLPAAGDFDGDGKADAAVFRPSTGVWFILRSSDLGTTITQFGQSGDQPAVGDYDGDGKVDLAVFRPADGLWWVLKSSDGTVYAVQWGLGSDLIIQ